MPVLVCEAHERMSIAVIRSLGNAGYPVYACSADEKAIGFHSNFVFRDAVCPSFGINEFSLWLQEYCILHKIKCIVPTENLLLEIKDNFDDFEHLLPLSQDKTTVYKGMSKFDLFQTLQDVYNKTGEQQSNLASAILVEKRITVLDKSLFKLLDAPFFIKSDGTHSTSGASSVTQKSDTVVQALVLVKKNLRQFDKLLIQGFSPGVGVGVFLLRKQGQIFAQFMHMRLHEIPIQGWSSYRKSWWNQDVYNDAVQKLEAMNWEGVAMMEYRWDRASKKFALIEMNGRFWGSLHLALYADVDFPTILIDLFHGSDVDPVFPKQGEVYCRNFLLEIRYVLSQLKTPGSPILNNFFVMIEFVLLTLNPCVKSDLFYPGDRKLFWLDLWGKLLLALDNIKK